MFVSATDPTVVTAVTYLAARERNDSPILYAILWDVTKMKHDQEPPNASASLYNET